MSATKPAAIYAPGQHPEADQLCGVVENYLPPHERQAVLAHLAACSVCRRIVSLSLPLDEISPTLSSAPTSETEPGNTSGASARSLTTARTTAWVVAGVTLPIVATILFLVVHQRQAKHSQPSATQRPQAAALHKPVPPPVFLNKARELPPKTAPVMSVPVKAGPAKPGPAGKPSDERAALAASSRPLKGSPQPPAAQRVSSIRPNSAAPQFRHPQSSRAETPLHSSAFATASGARSNEAPIVKFSTRPVATPAASDGADASRPLKNAPPPVLMSSSAAPAHPAEPSDSPSAMRYTHSGFPVTAAASPASSGLPRQATPTVSVPVSESTLVAAPALLSEPSVNSAPDRPALVSTQPRLPGGLPFLSAASDTRARVAIDTGNQLYLSGDAGQHWKAVSPPWRGRALSVVRNTIAPASAQPTTFAVPERFVPGEVAIVETDVPSNRVSGAVTDGTGAHITRATLTLTDSRSAQSRTVETDRGGRYVVANFVPGLYRLNVRANGFISQSLFVDLTSSSQTDRNITLEAGHGSETADIDTSSAPMGEQSAAKPAVSSKRRSSDHLPSGQSPQTPVFIVTTDAGERWISATGQTWKLE